MRWQRRRITEQLLTGVRAIDLLSTRGVVAASPRPEGGYAPGPRALWASDAGPEPGGRVFLGPPRPLLFQLMDARAVHSSDPDRFEPPWLGRRRGWLALTQIAKLRSPAARRTRTPRSTASG